ncbi:Hypothetical protein A7982_00707 [Minicystis rosea]|nr:Hypothetical protein A7982_00707 [Minicystis rosea]
MGAALLLAAAPARADGPSRFIASLPFGAGQFQNGNTELGVFFLASEAMFGAASIASVLWVNHLASTDRSGAHGLYPDGAALNRSIEAATVLNRVSFIGWAALTSAGVIEAHVRFAPRRADVEARPKITALAAPLPGGCVLGIQGAF